MKAYSTDLRGVTLVDPDEKERARILAEAAEAAESDYPEVFLSVPGLGTISFRYGGVMVWETEEGGECCLRGCDVEGAASIWTHCVRGENAALEALSWEQL
ncbi:MAG: hypothetical protein GVY10_11210 [Verrucomicrobia bacterium]|jgi:hypothetical protein|nr:hypothetical protein [Verrucomicrobiota bacterium]